MCKDPEVGMMWKERKIKDDNTDVLLISVVALSVFSLIKKINPYFS